MHGRRHAWHVVAAARGDRELIDEREAEMALMIDTTTPQGLTVQHAYCRVEAMSLERTMVTFRLRRYKDNTGLPAFDDTPFACPYDLAGENPFKQAYRFLRAQPDFADAINVLEAGQTP
ncbi:hypothetical protein DF107_18210 [Burkholderia stagnalis]|nr:hypothetical protein DF161_07135 [Burkholderia stagnalis]RQY80050.1 hypothetical protein DF107_18210 [Burkholderia stagnalis]